MQLPGNAVDPQAKQPPQQRSRNKRDQKDEPPCLVESWTDRYGQNRAGFIPNPIVVACDDAKPIVARGQVSVEGLPPGAGILPIGIDPVELVAKQNPFRDCKAQGGVVDFEPVGVGGEY